mmetsp:Transcript_15658/g.49026  ORF Transcript_15658/g.49026 Transcript_15658/m.49026 type:complete len:80 (-) Transcript_15658:121-360(-)|eukprot:CAMPEP_0170738934 /NCGR_PEP_ID=MMETSP0437-20130122/4902_1 /TAXON_ID=0 /ORGANISM="Sexangularia sp." /LENGTH=79 /DNA_ID=CAMNT_0011077375 /DNA_START=67 /DNA_END=306 /DNA_ORIENTATION=-
MIARLFFVLMFVMFALADQCPITEDECAAGCCKVTQDCCVNDNIWKSYICCDVTRDCCTGSYGPSCCKVTETCNDGRCE